MRFPSLSVFLALGVLGAVDADTPTTFTAINAQILKPSCAAFSSCHSAAGAKQAGKLDLSVDPYTALVGAMCDNNKAKAEARLRVKPSDSANSFLYMKLVLTGSKTGYGDPMPQSNLPLDAYLIEGVEDLDRQGRAERLICSLRRTRQQAPSAHEMLLRQPGGVACACGRRVDGRHAPVRAGPRALRPKRHHQLGARTRPKRLHLGLSGGAAGQQSRWAGCRTCQTQPARERQGARSGP